MRLFLYPIKFIYEAISAVRNWAFDVSLAKPRRVATKVISIGNLTVGGTGKTPVTLFLLEEIRRRGYRVGVVSRGYKRAGRGTLDVTITPGAAAEFGDEPALIKSKFPSVPVVVGNVRATAATHLLREGPLDLILCDDAFQHRRLHRDLDLVLLDATAPLRDYRSLPVGRARERALPALRRADFLILTKTNLVEEAALSELTSWLGARVEKPIVHAEYVLRGLTSIRGERREKLDDPVYLVSGVAKPATLDPTLGDRVRVLKHRTFGDHHRYLDSEIETILIEAATLGARWILTTAKDAVKLAAFPQLRDRLWVMDLGLELKGEVKEFYEKIDGLARSNA